MHLRQNVRVQKIGDEAVLVDLNSGLYFSLNESGYVAFKILLEGGKESDAVDEMQLRFDVSAECAENDIKQLLSMLHEKKLIS